MNDKNKPPLRCAVYTRKSTIHGLEQEYNSIDAQKDAGHAYIASQRTEGWIAVDDDYDDAGYSGGNMKRPALLRLLHDIEQGKIDIVVTYKIDRLSRDLIDFAKMVKKFEKYHVSFVCVTQQINSSTAAGRLITHIILSFAQYLREESSERVRDKMSASRKKGFWIAGIPPLGYDSHKKRLVINEAEAQRVRTIFNCFIEHEGATTQVVKKLRAAGIKSKSWTSKKGKHREGKLVDKSIIYRVLHNQTYLGQLKDNDTWHLNTHEAIIEQDTWDKAQAILKHNQSTRGNQYRSHIPFLLKGLVFAKDGRALTTSSAYKKNYGRRYRYYVHTPMIKEHADASSLPRMPAAELEQSVIQQLRDILVSPEVMQQAASHSKPLGDDFDEAQATVAMLQLNDVWEQLFPEEQQRIVHLLIDKVLVDSNQIELHLHQHGIPTLARELMLPHSNSPKDNNHVSIH